MPLKEEKQYNLGLVLSGGGARGFAHLGIAAALREKGIVPDIISGVSAGAIVGTFLAAGKTPEETFGILKKCGLFRFTKLQLPRNGLMRLDGLLKMIRTEIPYDRIEELPVPLYVGIADLTNGDMEYRNSGPLGKTVLASSSIPVLFSPVELNGCLYADGGLLNNIPVEPLVGKCRKIIVSNISPLQKPARVNGLIQVIVRTFLMSIHARVHNARDHADLYIEPPELTSFEILSVSHADEMYEIGYQTIRKMEEHHFTEMTALCARRNEPPGFPGE
ncbi:MAG: patatin-like phospholipase family protein [Prolixibacteraceae bacterium]|jgi:NTE family protein|nr:patatin-like phospholipase family protein [Prolixibacteraceae bacterium]MDI9563177.1 patatin-like phospholipase family protein [Bacteroidota bacterium]NLT00415.1 patatin-like phospholipase family protein [Bacteroidales bacterium]OQB81174.1 MAG: NTE family protein RssA [Bacteroidetes bacterium ADurb.Bin123]HNZ68516.1 patatin-like phospholipase family protein [Prolixibacteraceae bacterium]